SSGGFCRPANPVALDRTLSNPSRAWPLMPDRNFSPEAGATSMPTSTPVPTPARKNATREDVRRLDASKSKSLASRARRTRAGLLKGTGFFHDLNLIQVQAVWKRTNKGECIPGQMSEQ